MDIMRAKSEAKRRDCMLSEGLVIEILVWLPVSSLLRFKRVCKSWRSLISSPFFIQKHLQVCNSTTTTTKPNLLFKTKIYEIDDGYGCSTQRDTVSIVSLQTLQVIKARNDLPVIREMWWPQLLGSCNGLICLYPILEFRDAAIWNPATGEFKVLTCPSIGKGPILAAGFGFDANNNDYKLVLIHLFIVDQELLKPGGFQLEYYSLRTNSWTLVNEIQRMDLFVEAGTVGAYTNGMISWLACNVEEGYRRDEIISFDICNEVIIRTPLPNNIRSYEVDEYDYVNHVKVLNESFAVVSKNFDEFQLDIWVLREVGVVESWTKLFTVGCRPFSVTAPFVIWKEGLAFWNKFYEELILYDSANQQQSCIGIPEKQYHLVDAVIYRESLVRISSEATT